MKHLQTMKIKGESLDAAVAVCLGFDVFYDQEENVYDLYKHGQFFHLSLDNNSFSRTWLFGGPLIDRYRISLNPTEQQWVARLGPFSVSHIDPLTAAMRCLVLYERGDLVSIPVHDPMFPEKPLHCTKKQCKQDKDGYCASCHSELYPC